MSLMRIALRMSIVEALRGNTFADQNVLDSEIGAIDIATDGSVDSPRGSPFISVYTAEAQGGGEMGMALFGSMKTDLVLDMAVSALMSKRDDEGEVTSDKLPVVPDSDAAYEVSLDILQFQIASALNDPDNSWAEIVRKMLSDKVEAVEVTVGRSGTRARLSARQIRITTMIWPEPVSMESLKVTHPLFLFLAKLDEGDDDEVRDEDFKELAAVLRAILNGQHTGWKLDQARYGLSKSELDGMLVSDVADANISEVTFDTGVQNDPQ